MVVAAPSHGALGRIPSYSVSSNSNSAVGRGRIEVKALAFPDMYSFLHCIVRIIIIKQGDGCRMGYPVCGW